MSKKKADIENAMAVESYQQRIKKMGLVPALVRVYVLPEDLDDCKRAMVKAAKRYKQETASIRNV